MDQNTEADRVDEWAIVELFGHVLTAGRVSEVERYGGKMMRLDIPDGDGTFIITQFLGHASLYRVTMTTEATARLVAVRSHPEPVNQWSMPSIPSAEHTTWGVDENQF